ncbi:hypothetical protein K439DRAFT_752274 [Ramaria rubella]|nr:hypothetical protein K439DRAFT_752274 [Ramaria rubella]
MRFKPIFCYDYLLGISREVELMWQGRFHYATVLYFITRYFPIAYLTYNVAGVRADAHQS